MQRHTIGAFLVAPLIPGMLFGAYSGLNYNSLNPVFAGTAIGIVLGYPVAFVLGVPLYCVFRACGITGYLAYSLAGCLLGASAWFFLCVLATDFTIHRIVQPDFIGLLVVCGAVAGFAFWLMARPDRRSEG